MELSKTLKTIRGLIAKAESLEALGTPENLKEADSFRVKADELMQRYAIEEWQLLKDAPSAIKPERVKIDIGAGDFPFLSQMATLVNVVAKFCSCTSMWMTGTGWGSAGRQEYCYVYGYASDLRYFELLFTTLYLHMSGAIFPQPESGKSLGENAYDLHHAGMNWFDIAKAMGWRKVPSEPGEPRDVYVNRFTGERLSWSRSIGAIKTAYKREVERRGEEAVRIPPASKLRTYQLNAAEGYLNRLHRRFQAIAGQRGAGSALVLADKSQNIAAMVAEKHPDAKSMGAENFKYNAAAYARGGRHADTANLNPAAGSAPRKELG
jgi:hypothetical protein